MKKILLFLPFLGFGQNPATFNVWRIQPASICPGDTIRVNYKIGEPAPAQDMTITLTLKPSLDVLFTGNYKLLKNQPKETYPPLAWNDSTYVIKFKTPNVLAGATYSIHSPAIVPTSVTFIVKPTPVPSVSHVTICAGESHTFTNNTYSYSSGPIVTPSVTTFYTVSTTQNGCYGEKKIKVTVEQCSVTPNPDTGIEEHSLDVEPVYFDLFGNRTQKKPNTILIEQVGLKRRKIISLHTQ